MLSRAFLVAFLLVRFLTITWSTRSPRLDLIRREDECYGFEGHEDLYGFGIRLGVYLQWIASWIANSLNPKIAADFHDINSIFVLAIVCAMCATSATLRPVEVYIMLLICYGYFFTVLTVLGVRVRLLNPRYLPGMLDSLGETAKKWRTHVAMDFRVKIPTGLVTFKQALKYLLSSPKQSATRIFKLPLRAASGLKFNLFSWYGMICRITIASAVFVSSLVFWFGYWSTLPLPGECETEVYFFGNRRLEGHLTAAFKALTIIFAAPIFLMTLIALNSLFHIITFSYFYIEFAIIRAIAPQPDENPNENPIFDKWADRMTALLRRLHNITKDWGFVIASIFPSISGLNHMLNAWSTFGDYSTGDQIAEVNLQEALLDLFNAHISLLRGVDEEERNEGRLTLGPKTKIVFVGFHLTTVLTIVFFMAFIEMTIKINGISNAYTLGLTSQLLPFIVGLASFLGALREIGLYLLQSKNRNENENRATVSFEVDMVNSQVRMVRIVHSKDKEEHSGKAVVQGLQSPNSHWF